MTTNESAAMWPADQWEAGIQTLQSLYPVHTGVAGLAGRQQGLQAVSLRARTVSSARKARIIKQASKNSWRMWLSDRKEGGWPEPHTDITFWLIPTNILYFNIDIRIQYLRTNMKVTFQILIFYFLIKFPTTMNDKDNILTRVRKLRQAPYIF